jgi:hypothetical protein
MRILRRILLSAAGVTMVGGLSFAPAALAGPESATVGAANDQTTSVVTPLTDPSDGFCNSDELGDVKLGGDGHLYECSYVPGLGYYWLPY